jgi:hypothetical protein
MSIFQNKFFSVAGQAERIRNVGATLASAVSGGGVQAHTSSKTANKILSTIASHPFISAGVATGGIYAGKALIPAVSGSLKAGTGATAGAVAGKTATTSTLKTGLLYAGAGALAGSMLSGGGSLRQAQDANQYTQPEQEASPTQQSTSDITQDAFLRADGDIYQSGQGNILNANRYLRSSQDAFTYLNPIQTASPQQITTPSFSAGQSAEQGTNWVIPALIVAGALILSK